ncbi:hypothetical protein [Tropicimonas sp. S265A]|uniref:hypothetical protein n=1 Tax=Tropicimonas sp. S265A TaxID=3415134 RepID=UPI003C7B7C66
MKVSITQETRKAGLLGGKREWQTTMKITATEEEKAVVSSGNLGDFTLVTLPSFSGNGETEYTADQMLKDAVFTISGNQWHANDMAKRMKGGAAGLKSLIEETMADETGEFEL